MGVFSLTFVVFLVLKLCDVIDWSWWWVTAPLWGGILFTLTVVGLFWAFGISAAARLSKRMQAKLDEEFEDA